MENKIEELKDIQRIDKQIQNYYQQLDDIERYEAYLPNKGNHKEKVQTSGISDICYKIAEQVEDITTILATLITEAIAKRSKIILKLDKIENPEESKILYHRYVQGTKYEMLPETMNLSKTSCLYLLRRAEQSYANIT